MDNQNLQFYVCFNENDKALHMVTLSKFTTNLFSDKIGYIQSSFLRDDVAYIVLWEVKDNVSIDMVHIYRPFDSEFHFELCQVDDECNKRVLVENNHGTCERCGIVRCHRHTKRHFLLRQSFCPSCYEIAVEENSGKK